VTAIRLATAADVAALQPLVQRAYRGEASRAGWTHEADLLEGERISAAELAALIADPAERILIAEADGAMLGCVRVADLGGGLAYLGLLAVDPRRQAAGTGRALIAAAEALARDGFAAERIEMTVIDRRHELIAWYGRRGYAPAGTRPFPFPTDPPLTMVVLDKVLDGALRP
jgi:GNAT superfamily N-acetyltransferase